MTLIVYCACLALTATAQAADPIIRTIIIEGNELTDERLIRNVSGLRVGARLTPSSIPDAVRRIYGLGLFADVVLSSTTGADTTAVTIKVMEHPRLGTLDFSGNDKVKDEELRKIAGLREGQIINPHLTVQARSKIKSHYRSEGYYLATIDVETTPPDSFHVVDVTFEINENNKVSVEAVIFEGNTQFSDDDLQGEMSNKPKGFFASIFGGGNFNREQYTEDKEKLTEFYHKKGYLDFVIHSDTVIVAENNKTVTITMEVEEGPRYFFGETEFVGNELYSDEQLADLLKHEPGKIFNQEKFDESLAGIYGAYMERGYLYARILDETNTMDSVVNITLEISEGVPAHVHRIDIEGNTKTKDKVIRRELAIFPGQVLRRSALIRSVRNVMQLNYFGNVEPDYDIRDDGDVDLKIKVEEKPTNQFQVGGGYSAQDKLIGTVSLGWPNLMGNGQSLNMMIDFGSRRQSYSLSFTEPWFLNTPTTVGFDLFRTSRVWDEPQVAGSNDYVEERSGAGFQLGRRLRWPDDYFRVFGSYRWENISYTDYSEPYIDSSATDPFSLNLLDWPQVTSSMAYTVVRDSRDLPEFATKGSRAVYRVEFGGGLLGGKWNYFKNELRYSYHRPIIGKFVFAPKFELGVIQGNANIRDLPHAERFYAGGVHADGMIRGYTDGSIFATTAQDFKEIGAFNYLIGRPSPSTIRGRAMGVMNLELTLPLVSQQIYGLLFYDAGNVWENPTQMSPFSDMYTSVGFGLRITIPGMGLMGFDFGWPFRGDEKGKMKPHFQFGSSF